MKEELPKVDFHTQEERRPVPRGAHAGARAADADDRGAPAFETINIPGRHFERAAIGARDVEQSSPAMPHLSKDAALSAAPSPAVNSEPDEDAPLSCGLARHRTESRVYSRIGEWALQYRPPVFSPFQLSVSAIESYQRCPQRYLFSDVWRIPPGPRAATTFGNVMHTTIKYFMAALQKGQTLSWDDVATIFRREWTSAGFEDRYQEEAYQRDGLEQLRAFYTRVIEAPPDVVGQEKRFTLPMENGVEVTGRMDQINRLGPGEVEIVDYKTGRPKTAAQANKDLQLSVYALAAREELGLDPVRLVYYNLQTNEPVSATRDEKLLVQVNGVVQEVAADIRALRISAPARVRVQDLRVPVPVPGDGSAAVVGVRLRVEPATRVGAGSK